MDSVKVLKKVQEYLQSEIDTIEKERAEEEKAKCDDKLDAMIYGLGSLGVTDPLGDAVRGAFHRALTNVKKIGAEAGEIKLTLLVKNTASEEEFEKSFIQYLNEKIR